MFGFPPDSSGNTGILAFICRLSKQCNLVAVPDTCDGPTCAKHFINTVFRHHVLPNSFVSDRDPRFTGDFWKELFRILGTRLDMSTADYRKLTVKPNESIASLKMFCAPIVRSARSRGAVSSLWLSLQSTMRFTHLLDLLHFL